MNRPMLFSLIIVIVIVLSLAAFIGCEKHDNVQVRDETPQQGFSSEITKEESNPATSTGSPDISEEADYLLAKNYLDEDQEIRDIIRLHSGNLLVIAQKDAVTQGREQGGKTVDIWRDFEYLIIPIEQIDAGTIQKEEVFIAGEKSKTRDNKLFYDVEQYLQEGYVHSLCSTYDYWPENDPTDLLIFVTPNYYGLNPFEYTEFYGYEPSDTLGTEPYLLQDEYYWANSGFPIWIFDVPMSELTDDYQLEYYTYSVTGDELLHDTWLMHQIQQANGLSETESKPDN